MTASISRLYERMPPKPLATLSVMAALNGDAQEVERILAAVPRHCYRTPDMVYTQHGRVLETVIHMWALWHWRAIAKKTACGAMICAGPPVDDAAMLQLHQAEQRHTSTVLALDAALDAICAETGIDAEIIREWAGASPPIDKPLTPEAEAMRDDYLEAFRRIVG